MSDNLPFRFDLRRMMVAVAVAGVLFAALRYDVGMWGYVIFLAAFALFAASAAVASRSRGWVRAVALGAAASSCVAGGAAFFVFGVR